MATTGSPAAQSWKLSPSDFAFLWDDCKRCFYLKLVHRFEPPKMPFPAVFSKIGSLQKNFFDGARTQDLIPELPAGAFAFGERFVRSAPIQLPGRATTCYLSGRVDMVGRFEDGSFGVLDFKTSSPRASNMAKYARQLHAYAYALEHPAPRVEGLEPVSLLGLLVLDPTQMVRGRSGRGYYLQCTPSWFPVPRDDHAFLAFLGEVLDVLESAELPAHSESCTMCVYREGARSTGY
jgi:hypothetical protein